MFFALIFHYYNDMVIMILVSSASGTVVLTILEKRLSAGTAANGDKRIKEGKVLRIK